MDERLAIAGNLRLAGAGRIFATRGFCGMPGCGQIGVVGICQNNLYVR
jgi:hypothetical protein